ncbi:hypothetical protein JXB12_12225 [candidate division KSB1 bacterium]|nr:hypothetical protein [candidate division KSB1 bacterium]
MPDEIDSTRFFMEYGMKDHPGRWSVKNLLTVLIFWTSFFIEKRNMDL